MSKVGLAKAIAVGLCGAFLELGGCDSSDSTPAAPPVSAAKLQQNFTDQVGKGNYLAALTIAHTLDVRYPQSPEAVAVKARLPEIQTRASEQQGKAKAAADRTVAKNDTIRRSEFKSLLSRMSRSHDDVEHDTFYQPRTNPPRAGPYSYATLYIGQSDSGGVWLRTRLQYGGSAWIFFDTIKFSIDGVTLPEQNLGYFHVERDNGEGGVWEWVDMTVPDDAVPIFEAMSQGKVVIVRFSGKYRQDLRLSASARAAIHDTLRLYRLMQEGMRP